jgi:hypothetical protein
VFEGGKETWRDEGQKTEADEIDYGLYDRFVYLIFRFPPQLVVQTEHARQRLFWFSQQISAFFIMLNGT